MIRIFQPYPYVVTPSASCCAMVRQQYPELLHDDPDWQKPMNELRVKTYEFVEFLDKVLSVDLREFSLSDPQEITYHYTCHLRALGVKDAAVHLLRQIGNVQFKPMEKADECCGFGGSFAIKYPAISGAIVEDKITCIAQTGVKTVICNDAGCSMNISGMCHRRGMNTDVKHLAELMADAMGIRTDGW
jgi:L-lactate dehydrogenase complex protein LldE